MCVCSNRATASRPAQRALCSGRHHPPVSLGTVHIALLGGSHTPDDMFLLAGYRDNHPGWRACCRLLVAPPAGHRRSPGASSRHLKRPRRRAGPGGLTGGSVGGQTPRRLIVNGRVRHGEDVNPRTVLLEIVLSPPTTLVDDFHAVPNTLGHGGAGTPSAAPAQVVQLRSKLPLPWEELQRRTTLSER